MKDATQRLQSVLDDHERRIAALEGRDTDVDPPSGRHAYFDSLAPTAILARSFRDQDEIDNDVHGKPPALNVTYDPSVDAAQVAVPKDSGSIQQVRPRFPKQDSGKLLFTWDFRFDEGWDARRGGIHAHKMFQLGGTEGTDSRRLEPRVLYGESSRLLEPVPSDAIGWLDVRSYIGGQRANPYERLGPISSEFFVYPGRWIRWWALVDFAGAFSLWVADEQTEPVQMIDAAPIDATLLGTLDWFWIEFNSSQRRNGDAATIGHVRNLIVTTEEPKLVKP